MGGNSSDFEDRLLLMRAVIHQDRKSLASLYLKYSPRLRLYVTAYVSSDEEAEDMAQDVFLRLCQGKGHYNSRQSVESYLFGIARNLIRKYYREKDRSPQILPADSLDGLPFTSHTRERIDPVGRTSAKQLKTILTRPDIRLPAPLREAVELRCIEGLSCEQAARRLGCSRWAFYKRLDHAKKLLRKALEAGSQPPYEI